MVYGVDAKEINCDRLFNLLCCYGNCLKIKIMMSKPDTCMVQMGTPKEAASVIEHLQEVELFGNKLSFRPSKQNVSKYSKINSKLLNNYFIGSA